MAKPLSRHPLSALWGDITPEELAALTEDVRKNGVIETVVLHEGKILDGWNRYQASLAAETHCPTVDYHGDDPAGFVVSRNAIRRHWTRKRVAKTALKTLDWRPKGRLAQTPIKLDKMDQVDPFVSENEEAIPPIPPTEKELAATIQVSVPTIRRAKRELREERGEVSKRPAPKTKPDLHANCRAELEAAEDRLADAIEEMGTLREALADASEGKALEALDRQRAEIRTLRSRLRDVEAERDDLRRQVARGA